jgi:DNA helicase-2/ATP-dependent DNA helicase PcrA
VLVIAGAGSGKTRTIVYRLANMVQSGIPATSILLLTFTRKAAQEMLDRAKRILIPQTIPEGTDANFSLSAVQGGTFHSFAYSVLRIFKPLGYEQGATVMDGSDSLDILQQCREELNAGKGDRSFPRNQTVMALLSKSRNCELPVEDILKRESAHLLPHTELIQKIGVRYGSLKKERLLLDYDDLLFEFEKLLRFHPPALNYCRRKYRYVMVDEFQDTNLVQARITSLVAGAPAAGGKFETDEGGKFETPQSQYAEQADSAEQMDKIEPGAGNIMAVGDDAQSIYAFRGANVNNILNFPKIYPLAKIIRLEENYRSTQPVLDLDNSLLANSRQGFKKHLYTSREGGEKPELLRPLSDLSQGSLVAAKIAELLKIYPPHEIAVLFRAGYQSYPVEVQLNKMGLRFRKYGGIRYVEAAHVKDVMSFVRLVLNPLDFTAFQRVTALVPGIGVKTAHKLHQALQQGDSKHMANACAKFPALLEHLEFLNLQRSLELSPSLLMEKTVEYYQPFLVDNYPDDYPKRRQGLDELVQIATSYTHLDLFIADLSLNDPLVKEETGDTLTLSTIHSAKGLEWGAVLVLDLVRDRFPSRYAMLREEDYEEERRLMYVACTRAKTYLGLCVPASVYDRSLSGNIPVEPSPFILELSPDLYVEIQESFTGRWIRKEKARAPAPKLSMPPKQPRQPVRIDRPVSPDTADTPDTAEPGSRERKSGYCTHKIFGKGKVIKFIPPDKYQVNFSGFGLKVIMGAFLIMDE